MTQCADQQKHQQTISDLCAILTHWLKDRNATKTAQQKRQQAVSDPFATARHWHKPKHFRHFLSNIGDCTATQMHGLQSGTLWEEGVLDGSIPTFPLSAHHVATRLSRPLSPHL